MVIVNNILLLNELCFNLSLLCTYIQIDTTVKWLVCCILYRLHVNTSSLYYTTCSVVTSFNITDNGQHCKDEPPVVQQRLSMEETYTIPVIGVMSYIVMY